MFCIAVSLATSEIDTLVMEKSIFIESPWEEG